MSPARPGTFIAFEGGEGSGKSTQVRLLAAHLRGLGHEVVTTREPGGTPAAEAVRDLVLADALTGCDPWCEALLFAAARADHTSRVIEPALARGCVVLCDRYLDSSIAYQGVARGLGAGAVRQVNLVATRGRLPDLTVILDIDPLTGLARAAGRNRMEEEAMAFHARVRAAFLDFAAQEPTRYAVLSARAGMHAVAEQVLVVVDRLIAARGAAPGPAAGGEPR